MFANTKTLIVVVSCALFAYAQSGSGSSAVPTPTGIPTCVLTCATSALPSSSCTSITDLACICTSSAFQQAAGQCLQANCSAADAAAGVQIQQAQCASVGGGSSSSSASTPASTPVSTVASTGAASSASASATQSTKPNAAMALSAPFSLGGLAGTLVVSAGAFIGAAFVL